MTTPTRRITTRGRLTLAAVATMIVTLVFAIAGDGVSTDAGGVVGLIVNHAHTLVWALLTVALGTAAALGRWQRLSTAIVVAAVATYAIFVLTLVRYT